jgi:hypothetical protein
MSEQGQELDAQDQVTDQDSGHESDASLSDEDRAGAVGWHEMDGGLSATDFLAKRDDHNGLLRKDVAKLEKALGESNATQKSMAEFLQKNHTAAVKQGYDKAIADAQARMEQAVDDSDGDAFTAASKQKDQLEERKGQVEDEPIIKTTPANTVHQDIMAHQGAHPELFDTSAKNEVWEKELRYQAQRPGNQLSFDEAVVLADKAVKEQFFRQRSPTGPVGGEVASGAVSDFAKLPADAKQAYAMFAKGNPGFTKEAYLKSYNEA